MVSEKGKVKVGWSDMLVEFSVENFLSFRDRVTLSTVAANDKALRGNVLESVHGTRLNLLKSVAVYGPNASGKSNLLRALAFMRSFVLNSSQRTGEDSGVPVVPFKLDERCHAKPSTFEVVFIAQGIRFVYGFSVDSDIVREEWLSSYPRGQQRMLFERRYDAKARRAEVDFGPSWKGRKRALEEVTRSNALLLSVSAQFNHEQAQRVYEWFSKTLLRVSWFPERGEEREYTCSTAYEQAARREDYLRFLQQGDPGITAYAVDKKPLEKSHVPDAVKQALTRDFAKDIHVFEVDTVHAGVDTAGDHVDVAFGIDKESDGTQKLFALSGPWEHVLRNGCVLFVDELDVRLHPLLTRWLIELFHGDQTNPNGAQLFLTTHDSSLLSRKVAGQPLFRRDQVWCTQKDLDGATSLYSIWDFKGARKDEDLERGYLAGRYGAVPFPESSAG